MGNEYVKIAPMSVAKANNYAVAQTTTAIWTPASGKKVALFGAVFSTDTAGNVRLVIGTTTTLIIPQLYVPANGTITVGAGSKPIWVGAADQIVGYTQVGGGNNSVLVWGEEI